MKKLFAIKDVKVGTFGNVIEMPNIAVLTRELEKAILKGGNNFADYPADYEVYEIGDYNEERGVLIQRETPQFVVNMVSLKENVMPKQLKGENNVQ